VARVVRSTPRTAGGVPDQEEEPWVGMHRDDEIRPHALQNSNFIAGIVPKDDGTWPPAFLHPPHVPPLAPGQFTLLLSWRPHATTSLSSRTWG